jgi:dTDP-4-amino-4,6-dideoxygalactose transaminase
MSKVYFEPVHLTGFYRSKFGSKYGELPVTEAVSEQILSLPLYPTLTDSEVAYITGKINKFFKG